MKKQLVISKNYDLSDFPITRTMRQALRNHLIPVGNFAEGPGGYNLLALLFVHRLPYPFYWLTVFFEKQTEIFYLKLVIFFSHLKM